MTMPFSRRKLLADLRVRPIDYRDKHKPAIWAVSVGYAQVIDGRLSITASGLEALKYEELPVEAKVAWKAIPRLNGKTLLRTSSTTDEARTEGGGYLYTTEPDHRPFPTISARVLIERGWVEPADDGLFPGMSQTFRVPSHA